MSKLFGIIVCDIQEKWGGPHGIAQRKKVLFAEDGEEWRTFNAQNGEFPSQEELAHFQGFYISGSKHSVNDKSQLWIPKLLSFIQQCYCLKKLKVFGTCFGHQAMAKALGGRVALNPNKNFICGNEEITLNVKDGNENSEFIQQLQNINGGNLYILQSHGECVEELPKGAKNIGSSASCVHELVMYSDNMIGSQSHADFDNKDILDKILPSLLERNVFTTEDCENTKQSMMKPHNCPHVIKVITNFLKN